MIFHDLFFLKCIASKNAEFTAARVSATGRLIQTPAIPKKFGRINTAGIRKITCLESDIYIAFPGFPILWKKFDDTI